MCLAPRIRASSMERVGVVDWPSVFIREDWVFEVVDLQRVDNLLTPIEEQLVVSR